jgi:hypothetical protein
MPMKHNLRNLILVAVAVLFSASAFVANGAFGQGRSGATIPCPSPYPVHLTAQAPAAATPSSEFPSTCSEGWGPNFGGTKIDRCFKHTFTWKLPNVDCCQCVEGTNNTLLLQYKALESGASASSNDQWYILKGSTVVASGQLYSSPPTPGQPFTKTIPLKCDWLTKNNHLNFYVQDDTSVTSATLNVAFCCVNVRGT